MNIGKTLLMLVRLLVICSVALTLHQPVFAEPVTFLTHSVGNQTYIDEHGQLRGKEHAGRRAFNIEVVREMILVMGYEPAFELTPFKRGLHKVQENPGYALFNVNRTKSREATLKWVGPLQSSVTHFYDNLHEPTKVKSLADAKRVESICVLRGNVHHRFLEKNGFDNIFPANSYANCVNMLRLKRVSMTPLSNLSSLVISPTDSSEEYLHKTPVMLMESKGFLAFSKETSDEVIDAWQSALDSLVESGRYDELLKIYLIGKSL